MTVANQAIKELTDDGYTPIKPDHNAINLILADLGKADLSPSEVEELCQTAKVPTARGFVRLDLLPCGCERIFKGMILGSEHTADSLSMTIGGIEGVKPCSKHTELIHSLSIYPTEDVDVASNRPQRTRGTYE